jgi:quinoprotein glucose dehydrogenase
MDDAEDTLRDNLDGLDWLLTQLDGTPPPGPRPSLRVGMEAAGGARGVASLSAAFGQALTGGMLVDGDDAFRVPPITVELRARLHGTANFNILLASDTKASGQHWELFTQPGSGYLTVYTPGLVPDHLYTSTPVCNGEWRHIAMHYDTERIALFVDGEQVAAQSVESASLPSVPGGFGIGRLVEGGLGCHGELDDIRISRGIREIRVEDAPLQPDDDTIALWDFDSLPVSNSALHPREWEIEDAERRAALPEYQVIPAAEPASLAAAMEPPPEYFETWHRSHGDAHNTRYAAHAQITKDNVHRLKVAWEYRSGDGAANVQGNPLIVEGTVYGATAGNHIVAIDAATGKERWRFLPGGIPAHRGMVYWPGEGPNAPRLLFTAGDFLWALDPATGKPIGSFGEGGRVHSGESRVAGAVHEGVLVLPLFQRDVAGHDVITGERRWLFRTIPEGDDFGADTWEGRGEGANCWGGMALDDARGIAYIATGSPKPNFAGNSHHGQNLFANCVIAINARTGERVWHFQEIRHDIWDIDIPAPPNLVTIDFGGRRVDAVAQVTKLGNTLLLDRESGEPLFPVRLRRAPASRLPGERTWPYQPAFELPEPFARQEFTADHVTERTPAAREFVLKGIAHANYGWFETFEEDVPTVLYGIHGGAQWTGAAFDPVRGRLFVSSSNIPWIVTVFRPDAYSRDPSLPPTRGEEVYDQHCMACHGTERFGVGMTAPLHGLSRRMDEQTTRDIIRNGINQMPPTPDLSAEDEDALIDFLYLRDLTQGERAEETGPPRYTHYGYPYLRDDEGYPGVKPPWGTLNCIDLATGKLLWQRPLGHYPKLAEEGNADTGAENFGGPSVTAGGLVFCAGAPDGLIRAFDSDTGEKLWEHPLPFGGYAPPALYRVNGRDHVLIAATGGGKLGTTPGDAYVAFSLPE